MSSIYTNKSKYPRTTYMKDYKDFSKPENNFTLPSIFTTPRNPDCYREPKFPERMERRRRVIDALNNLQLTNFTCGRYTLNEAKAAEEPKYVQDPPVEAWQVCDYGRFPPPISPIATHYQASFKDPRHHEELLQEFKNCRGVGANRVVARSALPHILWPFQTNYQDRLAEEIEKETECVKRMQRALLHQAQEAGEKL